MKQVIVYSTSGASKKVVQTEAATWGDLQVDLDSAGVTHKGMKAIIGGFNLTLESSKAVLPNEDFKLFLSPVKIKSGVDYSEWSYRELKTAIKELRDSPEAVKHFGDYTHDTTKVLVKKLTKWSEGSKKVVAKKATVVQKVKNMTKSTSDSSFTERLHTIEYKLNILNSSNSAFYDKQLKKDFEELKSSFPKNMKETLGHEFN